MAVYLTFTLMEGVIMRTMDRQQQVAKFFDRYEKRFNDSLSGNDVDVKAVVESFTSCFMESNPNGVICGKNDESFEERIGEGFSFYRNIGTTGMHITAKDIEMLDDFHAMARITWKYTALKEHKDIVINFNVTYFLQTIHDTVKIFAYITGDEHKVLREHGLI